MSKNYWLIVLFVATMVCNGLCRPREVDSTNMYPVYRSVKQLELDTAQNRYEKPFRVKRNDDDDDSVTYMRIDIPYKNVTESRGPGLWVSSNDAGSNNTKSVIDYVPVALTVKKTNIKKWPSDQNGIESADDLALYNIYTNNINPLNSDHQTTQGNDHVFTYPPHSKPSILILEELTTRKPFQDYPNSVYTRPIQVLNRPVQPPHNPYPVYPVQMPHRPTAPQPPVYVEHNFTYEIHRPVGTTSYPITPDNPIHPGYGYPPDYNPNPGPILPPYPPSPPFEQTTIPPYGYIPSTSEPETTTKKVKNTKCPSVSIIATNAIHNINNVIKEGCQDINIHINTNVNNSNAVATKPSSTHTTTIQNSPTTPQFGLFSILGVFWSIISRFFNFSFSNPFLSTILAPFLVFALPWALPHLISGRKRHGKRLIVFGNQENRSTKYLYRSIDDNMHYLKRTTRDLRQIYPMYRGWSERKKIPRSEPSENQSSSVKIENESSVISNTPKEGKIGIESIATVARASSDGPSLSSSATIGQLMDTVGQMVDSDIRTPPKLKEIIKEKFNDNRREVLGEEEYPVTFIYDEHGINEDEMSHFEFTEKSLLLDSSEGKAAVNNVKVVTDEGVKGIAIPVVMDEDLDPTVPPKKLQKIPEVPKPVKDDKKKNGITKSSHSTTTPSSGLSTWILLSDNREVTTVSPKKNGNNNTNNKKEGNEDKKKTAGAATTTKKPAKVQTTTQKTSSTQAVMKTTTKPGNKTPEDDTSSMSALEAMVKNQKKSLTTTAKPKTNEDTKSGSSKRPSTDSKKKIAERIDVAETKDKFEIELPDSKNTYTLPPRLPIATDDKAVTTSSSQNSPSSTTENSVEGTTKKKKVSSKKKKKNKNRRRKPSNDTGVEAKIPKQPVSSQIYSFISREIVPTVGLGLIGVALTAGLASFLGYNPFQSSTVPLRRTYVTNHGYSPNNYYNYNTDYGDGGQSEEVLFREVLSGMPEESRYDLTHTETSYPEAYNRQDQVYDNMKTPIYGTGTGSVYGSDKDMGSYDANYPQDYSTGYGASYDTQDKKYSTEVKDKYPVYNRDGSASFVYPDTNGVTPADKASRLSDEYSTQSSVGEKFTKPDTIERQPEALYRVASESDLQYRNGESTIQGISSQSSWHRIGSPMEAKKHYPHLEPGPRSLDLSKEPKDSKALKRSKRGAESVIQRISRKRTKKENDVENEIDFDENRFPDQNPFEEMSSMKTSYAEPTTTESTTTSTTTTTTAATTTTTTESFKDMTPTTTEDGKEVNSPEPTETYETESDPTGPGTAGVSVLDVLKRLAQFKLRLGLSFLRSTTDMFSRYLDDIQRRVDETFINTTTVQYNRRNPWSRIFFSRLNNDEDDYYRRKRSVLNENQFPDKMFKSEQEQDDKTIERFSKSTKKDLKPSNKIFHQKKNAPKKYESRDTFKI